MSEMAGPQLLAGLASLALAEHMPGIMPLAAGARGQERWCAARQTAEETESRPRDSRDGFAVNRNQPIVVLSRKGSQLLGSCICTRDFGTETD
jgi:hypothetical protein